jgi:site-specific recombinase XerD
MESINSEECSMTNYRTEAPEILRDFLAYHETIKAHSPRTVDEYYLDLRNFFRYLKRVRDPSLQDKELDEISIQDVDLDFVKKVTLTDIYDYMTYLSRDRVRNSNSRDAEYGLNAASRARKIATIRSFYHYLTNKVHLIDQNPVKDIDSPKLKKSLPKYLTLDESVQLLESVEGKNQERDYCILTLFLNCGLRISELVGLNLNDIQDDALRILGKGNKVRIVYLNEACKQALEQYLAVRRPITGRDKNALFLSTRNERISRSGVHALVKKHLSEAGLDATQYSSHKLRHTAATLMLQNGVDVKAVQEVLGHDHLNTTEIYTHIDNDALRIAAKANPLSHIKKSKKKTDPTPEKGK